MVISCHAQRTRNLKIVLNAALHYQSKDHGSPITSYLKSSEKVQLTVLLAVRLGSVCAESFKLCVCGEQMAVWS